VRRRKAGTAGGDEFIEIADDSANDTVPPARAKPKTGVRDTYEGMASVAERSGAACSLGLPGPAALSAYSLLLPAITNRVSAMQNKSA
jgi:hypothetical protein